MIILHGSSHPSLARDIAERLSFNGKLVPITTRRFADGELHVKIESNVRGEKCYVVQPTCAPGSDAWMELFIILDTLKRASAAEITAVLPYYGYARQERKSKARTPITAKLVANLLVASGASRVLTVDLHAAQIQGFFDIPCDNLFAAGVLADAILEDQRVSDPKNPHKAAKPTTLANTVIVSPDVGGVARARAFAERLGCSMAIIDKRRQEANKSEVMNVIGDVEGKHAILVDDIIDTAGTLCNAADAVMSRGALSVSAAATHGVFSGPAFDRLSKSKLERVWVTDSIPRSDVHPSPWRMSLLRYVSLAPMLAKAIHCIHNNQSLSSLFE